MSYDEVARGLPPVNDVLRGTWSRSRPLPVSQIRPTWALITPVTVTDSPPKSPRVKRRSPAPVTKSNHLEPKSLEPDHGRELQVPGSKEIDRKEGITPPPITKRYLIEDGDDNSMKVTQLDSEASIPGTLEMAPVKKPRKARPKLTRQNKSSSLTIPTVRVTACPKVSNSPSTAAIARRARHFVIFLLTLLPPLFFTVAVQYIKFNLASYGVGLIGLCVFQAVFWPSLVFLIFSKIWLKLSVLTAIQAGWCELLTLLALAPAALLLQIVSLMNLEITTALALLFAPLVIASFIGNISVEKSFSLELCITSIVSYLGMTLIGVSILFIPAEDNQETLLLGFGASIGSMILTIAACLLLVRLRRQNVDDSVTSVTFVLGGTILSSAVVLVRELGPVGGIDLDPAKISTLATFIFFGTIFQFIESKINQECSDDPEKKESRRGQRSSGFLRLSKTRFGLFLLCCLWELVKIALKWTEFYFPSPFLVFGCLFLIFGYILTVGYESWLRSVKRSDHSDKVTRNRCLFLPWLFSRKS